MRKYGLEIIILHFKCRVFLNFTKCSVPKSMSFQAISGLKNHAIPGQQLFLMKKLIF
ncbi:hypothetical protein Cs308_0678 [Candidatus Chlamydia sanziniae]|uniref:Uncharacterized protein n=1 Tax=Candidatus Chlamydia sanziniae TaxID=1806891 RepID=A0A1A9HV28_9CHLA|nr:hypothetical protein Cs308_0678 [Candidatus Chlamydia sanziniae]